MGPPILTPVLLLPLLALPAAATIIEFEDRLAWEAAVGSAIYSEDFQNAPLQTLVAAPASIVLGPMTFTSDHPTTIYSIGIEEDLGSNRYFKGNVGNNEDLTYQRNWIDFAGPISALAFDALRFENDFAVVLYDGDTRVGLYGAPSLPREDYPYFVGLVSDVPFTRAEIACDGCGYRLDDVSIPVPEPNTAMLLAAGLLMLGSARRT